MPGDATLAARVCPSFVLLKVEPGEKRGTASVNTILAKKSLGEMYCHGMRECASLFHVHAVQPILLFHGF
jgi:hypothetical protein